MAIELTDDDIKLINEWFEAVQDLNHGYLEKKDYLLAKRIYEHLGRRVPHSVIDKTV